MRVSMIIKCRIANCDAMQAFSVDVTNPRDMAETRAEIEGELPEGWGVNCNGEIICPTHLLGRPVTLDDIKKRRAESFKEAALITWARRYYEDVGVLLKRLNAAENGLEAIRLAVQRKDCTTACSTVNDECVSEGCALDKALKTHKGESNG